MVPRDLDVLVFGATGFSGKLVAQYLARRAGVGVRWGLAGRDRVKLEGVRRELAAIDPRLVDVPIVQADVGDRASLEAIAQRARVVCTTVGPYRKYGTELVAACARFGTHYCDLTGEVPFMRASIEANHSIAESSGARIVHACGFDSIPSDLGTMLLWDHARTAFGEDLAWVGGYVTLQGRGAPGGVESALGLIQDARRDPGVRKLSADPYALVEDRDRHGPPIADRLGVRFDRELDEWTGPFVMSIINTRVVRRSAAITGYGSGFVYEEAMSFGRGFSGFAKATGMAAGVGMFVMMAYFPMLHGLVRRFAHAESTRRGSYRVRLLGRTVSGRKIEAHAAGDGDPGCEPTAMMLAESALCLALDDLTTHPCGVLTPATAMGSHLAARVRGGGMGLAVEAASAAAVTEPVIRSA